MWLVVSVSAQDIRYPIVGDKTYVVGRSGCDITINDPSVSRKQAMLSMAHSESNVVKSFINPTLTLEDTSKFGTFVNGKSMRSSNGCTVSLKDGDEIQFGGSPASKFKAVYEQFIATTSCLEKAPKKSLQKIMCLLGGHVVRDWRNNCDLLIMSKINVTIKVICAINNQKHIVTPVYLNDYHKHLLGQRSKPNPTDYLPEVVDKEVPPGVSFHPDVRRVTLLSRLKFYFLSAVQFNKTNMAVSTAGGLPILLEDGTEEDADGMTQEGTIVVSVSREILSSLSSTCQKFVRTVCSALKRNNLRMVTDPEIGWAILTCNTNDFCNPKSAITPSMFSSMATQSLSQMMDTEASQIPLETVTPLSRSYKRPSDVRQEEMNLSENQSLSIVGESLDILPLISGRQEHDTQSVTLITSNAWKLSPPAPNGSQNPDLTGNATLNGNTKSSQLKESHESLSAKKGFASRNNGDNDREFFAFSSDVHIKGSVDFADGGKANQRIAGHLCNKITQDITNSSSAVSKTRSLSPQGRSDLSEKKPFKRNSDKCSENIKSEAISVLLEDSDEERPMTVTKTPEKTCKITSLFSDSDGSPSPKRKTKKDIPLFNDSDDEDKTKGSKKFKTGVTENCADVEIEDVETLPFTCVKIEESCPMDRMTTTDPNGLNVSNAWVAGKTEVKFENGLSVKQEIETEVFLDGDGHPIKHFCRVTMIDLLARPDSRFKKSSSKKQQDKVNNFKRFKKAHHVGSGQLPRIIGGRDLQPHIGNKLQALEGLLSEERRDERQTNPRRGDQLFDWDDDPVSSR